MTLFLTEREIRFVSGERGMMKRERGGERERVRRRGGMGTVLIGPLEVLF
jgi:hypothetical protein